VLETSSLLQSNQLRLQDYYSKIPGLNLVTVRGASMVYIRGISTGTGDFGPGNPTVSSVVDDAPYGSSSALAGGGRVPDIDPNDLARVEVLRGPQGTLYGASSIGGLLKFVTVDPSTDAFSGRVQLGMSSVRNGDDPGYSVRGAINVPLSDTWAVRASAYTRRDPGYIDNVTTNERAVNSTDVDGGLLSTLWQPSAIFSLKLTALLQNLTADASSLALPSLGDLEQDFVKGTGDYAAKIRFYSATANVKLGNIDLTSISSYGTSNVEDSIDLTPAFGDLTEFGFPAFGLPSGIFDGYGVRGTPLRDSRDTKKFSQEIRMRMPIGQRLEWLLGAFYTDEQSKWFERLDAVDSDGARVGTTLTADWPTDYSEYAFFTDLTVKFTDRFDIQFGGRQSRNRQGYSEIDGGVLQMLLSGFTRDPPVITPRAITQDSSFTYLVTPRLRLSPELMLYARLASGYRPGGPNSNYFFAGAPAQFAPDKTRNYEVGLKGSAFDNRLSFDTSVYYINWEDIQIQLNNPATTLAFTGNASRARSKGIELSVEARPLRALTASAWVALNDAELTEDFPVSSSAYGRSGDRLPDASRFSGGLSLQGTWPLTGAVTAMAGGSLSYVGQRQGGFTGSALRQDLPGYARTDLHAGATFSAWTANLFVTNLTDRRGIVTGGIGTANELAFSLIQPRTYGLSLSREF
jgi:outer membrane receptor protein involved in Fe transport